MGLAGRRGVIVMRFIAWGLSAFIFCGLVLGFYEIRPESVPKLMAFILFVLASRTKRKVRIVKDGLEHNDG